MMSLIQMWFRGNEIAGITSDFKMDVTKFGNTKFIITSWVKNKIAF